MNKKIIYRKLKKIKFIGIIVYINLFYCFSVFSQTDSLLQYLNIATKNNPVVMQKFLEYQAALQKLPQVSSLPDPELNVGVFLSPMEVMNGYQVADIKLMQMFPWFGVLKNAKDEMSMMAKAKYESFQSAKLQLYYDVKRSWYELVKIKQNILISEKNLEILNTLERLSLIKFKASSASGSSAASSSKGMSNSNLQNTSSASSGMNSMGGSSASTSDASQPLSMQKTSMSSSVSSGLSDVYRIQIEIAELNNSIELLKDQQNTQIAKFNALLNRPASMEVVVPDSLIAEKLEISLISVTDSILANNPMLSMLQYEQKSFESKKKMVTAMAYPMVGLGVNYSLIKENPMSTTAMNGQDMIMPMATVTLPIYRRKYNAMKSEADLLTSATRQNYQATSNSLQTEYYEALQLYQDAMRRMKLYENQSLLANKTLDIMIKSFSASGSGLTDVLQIRQQLLNYEFKKVEALNDFNTAIAWINKLMANSQNK